MTLDDVADVRYDDAGGVPWAFVTLRVPVAIAAPVLLAARPGRRVVTDDEDLVTALVAGGGRVQRRGHDYTYDLSRVPASYAEAPAPQGFSLTRSLDVVALAAVQDAANPPGHPDHDPALDHVDDVRAMVEGRILGPLVPQASWQACDDAGPCGAVFVVARPRVADRPPSAWVVDVFVHPRAQRRGVGGALLRRALAGAAQAGHATLGLVVSDGNPARAAYESVGFTHVRSGTNVDLP